MAEQYGAGLVACAVLLLAAADGGFFPESWRWGAVLLAAGGAAAGILNGRVEITRAGWALLGGLAALAGWTALSAAWSADAHASLTEAQRVLFYAVAAAAFLVARRGLSAGLVLGAAVVAAWALATRGGTDPFEGSLLVGPIGYANGLAALVAMAAVVAVLKRGWWLLSLAVLVPALLLTNSRAALAIAVVGVIVGSTRRRGAVLAAATVALVVLLVVPFHGLSDRGTYWQTGRHLARNHLVAGSGAGTFGRAYRDARPQGPPARNAHSLYLETLDELGVVGLALLLFALATPLLAGLRTGNAAAVGGYTVFLLHAGVDWDWQLAAVVVGAVALAAEATLPATWATSSASAGRSFLPRAEKHSTQGRTSPSP